MPVLTLLNATVALQAFQGEPSSSAPPQRHDFSPGMSDLTLGNALFWFLVLA